MVAINKVMVAGNLTRDPELRRTSSGTAVGSLGLAVNERFTTREGEQKEEVCFVDVEVWGKQAEACGQYLRKGASALVEGRLRCDRWEDRQTGQQRSRLLVRADRVQFVGQSGREKPAEPAGPPPFEPASAPAQPTRSGRAAPAGGRREAPTR